MHPLVKLVYIPAYFALVILSLVNLDINTDNDTVKIADAIPRKKLVVNTSI